MHQGPSNGMIGRVLPDPTNGPGHIFLDANMSVNIGDKPQADFSNPIALMMDCHRRIERFLQALRAVASNAKEGTLDQRHRTALDAALHYFVLAGPRHNQDEEASLFPALSALSIPEVAAMRKRLAQVAQEHADAQMLHQRIEALGRAWLDTGAITQEEWDEFGRLVDQLLAIYTPHIALEEREIFPLAARVLDSQVIAEIGRQMRARRNI
jgi:hemerythrin-like domain-containing protein